MTPEHAALVGNLIARGWSVQIYAKADNTISPPAPGGAKVSIQSPAGSTSITGEGTTIDQAFDKLIADAKATSTVLYRIAERHPPIYPAD